MKKKTYYYIIKTLAYDGNRKNSEIVAVTKNEISAHRMADTMNARKGNPLVDFAVRRKSFDLVESPVDELEVIAEALSHEFDDINEPIR